MYKAFFYFCAMLKTPNKLIIAIDGFSSSGKSTIAKDVAKKLHYRYLDTGAMYRAVTYKILKHNIKLLDIDSIIKLLDDTSIDFKIVEGENHIFLDGVDIENKIRELEVANNVSEVSSIPTVRKFLVKLQQEIGKNGNIVMDGRDIGTVVFPNADIKFFVSASLDTRAKRRFEERKAKNNNKNLNLEEVKDNLAKRDKIDSERKHSPLKVAKDAILLDTECMTKQEQLDFVLEKIKENTK